MSPPVSYRWPYLVMFIPWRPIATTYFRGDKGLGRGLNPCFCLRHAGAQPSLDDNMAGCAFFCSPFRRQEESKRQNDHASVQGTNVLSSQHCTGLTGHVTNANSSQDLSTPLTNKINVRLPTTRLHLGITRSSQPRRPQVGSHEVSCRSMSIHMVGVCAAQKMIYLCF
jgi:hypothetical protein